jgi:uncharacterized protein YjbI with pentapeptide repeats
LDKCQPYEKEILISFLFFCAGFIIGWMLRSFHEGRADAETIRNAILIIGGLMAFYGLVQATKRQESFAEQVDTQIKQAETAETQLFNDRLGRGVELLANPDKMYCKAGIRVLEDLANSVDVIEHKKIIANLLHDFIKDRAAKIYQDDKNGKMAPVPVSRDVDRSDVQLALDVYLGLMCLFDETEQRQSFTNLDLSYLNFSSFKLPDNPKDKLKKIHSIDFSDSILNKCNFKNLNIVNCSFLMTGALDLDFYQELGTLYFEDCIFSKHTIKFDGLLGLYRLKNCDFYNVDLNMSCSRCEFLGGRFYNFGWLSTIFNSPIIGNSCSIKGKQNKDITFKGTDISNLKLQGGFSFLSTDHIASAVFCEGSDISSFEDRTNISLNRDREYMNNGLGYYFITSDAEWSGRLVYKWVAIELARMELNEHEEKSNRFGTQNIKDKRERLTNKLAQAEQDLEAKEKEYDEVMREFKIPSPLNSTHQKNHPSPMS